MPGAPVSLARWDDFSAGHWGATGGVNGRKGSWGGKNMLLTRSGTLAPVAASRPMVFSNLAVGEIFGMHWAWGADGLVYFVQQTDDTHCIIRRFEPDFTGGSITVVDVGAAIAFVPTRPPGWCAFSDKVYVTMYGDNTYEINPAGPSRSKLTGGAGDAPGGRAVYPFGERLWIAGMNDDRYGNHGNRVVFSEAADLTDWPSLNFFDVGADNTEIAGLYVMQDVVDIIFSDQQIWTFRGNPAAVATASLRRVYGYHAGSGGITTFTHDNAVVDPGQGRLWVFDHTHRGLAQFNGAQLVPMPGFGIVTRERTSELNPDGVMVAHGGPGDLVVDRVPVPKVAGAGAAGESNVLVRINNAVGLVDQRTIVGIPAVAAPVAPACVTESFDTADTATLGPDVTWDQYGFAQSGVAVSSSLEGAGVGGHVKDNACTLFAPAASPPAGDQWLSVRLAARTDAGYVSDVAVSADVLPVVGQPTGTDGNLHNAHHFVMARMETEALDNNGFDLPTGFYAGLTLQGIGAPTYFWRIVLGWKTPTYSAEKSPQFVFAVTGDPPASIGLTVTGSDSTLALTAYADGVAVDSWDMATIISDGFTDVLDDPTFLPRGTHVGFDLYGGVDYTFAAGNTTGSFHDHDDEVGIDNFSACPA